MNAMSAPSNETSLFRRLASYLEHDPDNLALIADAATAAADEGETEAAAALLARHAALAPLPPALLNLGGLIAMQEQRYADAAAAFAALREAGEDAPPIRFNLAWALAMAKDYEPALALLDDEVIAVGPRAAALKIQLLHQAERLDEALACGAALAETYPDESSLMGALASAALDAEQIELARAYARRAGSNHDGLATMGLLLLDENRLDESAALFDRVLGADPANPRALLGAGLGRLQRGDAAAAADRLDAAARRFEDHLGSWVAAGWAHYIKGDMAASRARFETALALDDTFAETHGGLAVLDIVEGDLESGRRRADVALRLDRNCLAGALAKSMILEKDGKAGAAQKVREAALNAPVGTGGRTIARSLAMLGRGADGEPGEG
jgi:tetratricopeptide (TPR) repeat protein